MSANIKIVKCIHNSNNSYLIDYMDEYDHISLSIFANRIESGDGLLFLYGDNNRYLGYIDKLKVINLGEIEWSLLVQQEKDLICKQE